MRPAMSSPRTYGLQSWKVVPVPNAAVTFASAWSSAGPFTPAYQAPVESAPHTSTVKTSASPSWITHSARLNCVSMLGVRRLCASSCTPQAPILDRL